MGSTGDPRVGREVSRMIRCLSALFLAVVALAPVVADAEPLCRLSDGPDTFGVIEWVNPSSDWGTLTLQWGGRDVFERSDGDNYQMVGLFVIDVATARTVATGFHTFYDASTRIYAEVGGTVLIDQTVPTSEVPAGHGNAMASIPGRFPVGTYHIVGISMGGGSGIGIEGSNDRTEAFTEVRASGVFDCTKLAVDADLLHLDERDLTGTQLSAPGFAYRPRTTATYVTDATFVVGALQHDVSGAGRHAGVDTSYSRLHIDTPTGAGWLSRDIAPISSTSGTYRFTAEQLGALGRVNINALAYTPLG